DFLTRLTSILGGLFIALSIALAGYAGINRKPVTIDTSLVNQSAPAAVAPAVPVANQAAPAANEAAPAVPLAQ
ncbi:MAG: preprotein translocase subunit SecG, partial [Sphingomicrobium sp.]